jgi:hypothetical protein
MDWNSSRTIENYSLRPERRLPVARTGFPFGAAAGAHAASRLVPSRSAANRNSFDFFIFFSFRIRYNDG